MYNPRNSNPYSPYGRGAQQQHTYGSRYQYEAVPIGYEGAQASSLIGKVMGLLAFSFIFASIGAFVGISIGLPFNASWIIALLGLVVLIALNFLIQKPGLNLVLLYLFTFLEGLSLAPLIGYLLQSTTGSTILMQAFLTTAIVSLGLGLYAWTTKRDFTRLGDYLFFGVILLLVASLIGIFFRTELFVLIISIVGIAIFSGYVPVHLTVAYDSYR
jgi:FtsH-binding integral membrane protein